MQPPLRNRILLALAFGSACGLATWTVQTTTWLDRAAASDFAQIWYAGSAWRRGINPYEAIGPGREFPWQFELYYPLTAVIVGIPMTWLPLHVAEGVFVGLGCAALAFALTKRTMQAPQLLVFFSFTMIAVFRTAQWSPLVTAAGLIPSLAFLLACKPTVGLSFLVAYPSVRAFVLAGLFMAVTLVVWPWWPADWLAALRGATHITAPVMRPGGFLILLALFRWRRPEARLLAALAVTPQSPSLYETVPLFLVASTPNQAFVLLGLSAATELTLSVLEPYDNFFHWMAISGRVIVFTMFLPCVAMVLRRPNASSD